MRKVITTGTIQQGADVPPILEGIDVVEIIEILEEVVIIINPLQRDELLEIKREIVAIKEEVEEVVEDVKDLIVKSKTLWQRIKASKLGKWLKRKFSKRP